MLFQWSMYFLSYVPLWVCVIFQEVMSIIHGTESPWIEWVSIIVLPISMVLAALSIKKKFRVSKTSTQKFEIEAAQEEKFATAEFLATFIIPLFAFDFTTWEGMTLFSIFFFCFGFLCYRHNYFCTNIVLDLMKYRVYDCTLVDSNEVEVKKKVISKRDLSLSKGTYIYARGLNNDYSFDCFDRVKLNDENNVEEDNDEV